MTNPRLSVSGRRYFKDIIYLAILTVVIPLLVSSYLYAMKKPDKSFYDLAAWTFVVGLVFFHILCFLRKDNASPQLPRIIDYIYVCSAVIGLSGTAVEVDRTVKVNTYLDSVRLSKLNLNWMNDQVNKAAKAVCAENGRSAQCADLTSIRTFIEEGLPNVLATNTLEAFEYFSYKVDGRIATLKELPEDERAHIMHYDGRVQRLAAITAVPPEESEFRWKLLAVVFLPSALALRITKISVEIFGWFPKT
jgi:hypothetical protein